MLMIDIQEMTKTYRLGGETVHALRGISLQVKRGDFVAIVGPSGSGKSTLMNMIGCLDRPDSGSYRLDGKEVRTMKDDELAVIRNQKIGFVFQNFNLLSKLTALENVELPLIYRGMKVKERRTIAYECLEKVGLQERVHHLPNQLSGGQQQRVAIARALVGHPPILLADEPTGALDSKTSKEIMHIMKQLNEQGHTIVLITHDWEVAREAKRIVRIQDGELLEERGEFVGDSSIH
ncbi:macrolide ABC transporter ATP-binding protein [Geobacillus thermocatenulatus]|uniref:Macrolide ABC transporter ATP-binding protein n=1 Tax=Geobacillus thermocatenulatus TaxID=33938 RepID=A0A226Q5A2_9BACL|nr:MULTISPECIES: ABC transporter ATP-binding protein [Geobacillus]AST00400.1 macrolide ABC transporter ATP-binding protein [Geobacillus thermocatenulatus]KLR75432.1 macrolide ABC transporter ATP-binding protein [Geobacillus sp. T6]OXB86779.1 macrolide ABC transporter ATP-binding protein [Geobacillus thermocatenulatus]